MHKRNTNMDTFFGFGNVSRHNRISDQLCEGISWRRVAEWLQHSTAKQKVAGSNPTRASGWKTPSVHLKSVLIFR